MDVRVLGTHFNVTAYEDETNSAVVLVEGGVEITTPKGLKQKIQPNERLVLKGNQMEVSNVNVYDYTSWKDGVFLFNNQRLTYVTQRLSRYYRMEFVCDPEVEYYTCSGKLVLFDDLNKVLHTLEKSLPISCEINGNTINLSTNTKKRMPMK